MPLNQQAIRRLLWRRRVNAARAWQNAARAEWAAHQAAKQRIIEQAPPSPQAVPIPGLVDDPAA